MHWLYVSIDVPGEQVETSGRFWSAALGWELGAPWRSHPEFRSLTPPSGDAYAHLQQIEGGPGVHFDIGACDVAEESARLVAAGATVESIFTDWQVLRSPGGLAFCVVPSQGRNRPGSSGWPDGHRSRLVQICIDSPADTLDAEVAFWRAATEWDFRLSTGDEFAGKLYPPAPGPVQLLFQRLGSDDRGDKVRAHIDLGTDDKEAESTRLEALGATRVSAGDGWILLTDPIGMPFCATGNNPD